MLIKKSDCFSYEIMKGFNSIKDDDDNVYFEAVNKAEKIFDCHYKIKNRDERGH